jgi:signal transduction histidine kinase
VGDAVQVWAGAIVTGRPESQIPRRRVVVLAASAFAFALVLLPGPQRDIEEIGIAAGLCIAVVGLSALWQSVPALARIGVPLAYVAVVAVLIDGGGGTGAAELEEAARQLADQNKQLRELDHAKDEFVALVSHELRTPLTSIIGYLEMVLEQDAEPLTTGQRQFLSTVSRNVERLATLVNELLFLVQADAGRLQLTLGEADINQLLTEATEAAQPAANAKQIELTLEAGPLTPAVCDRSRIAQLVDNLVSNAVKFTPQGGRVEVKAAQEGSAIALSVSDTGMAFPPTSCRDCSAVSFALRARQPTRYREPVSGWRSHRRSQKPTTARSPSRAPLAQGTTFRLRLAAGN